MENSDNEAEKNLKSFLCRVRASNECTACRNVLNDPVATDACEHEFCRSCFVQLTEEELGKCPKCDSVIVKSSLKDVHARVLAVSNTVNQFVKDYCEESGLKIEDYMPSPRRKKPLSNPAISPKPESKVAKWLDSVDPGGKSCETSSSISPVSRPKTTSSSDKVSLNSWRDFAYARQQSQPVKDSYNKSVNIDPAPSPPPRSSLPTPTVKPYARRGRGAHRGGRGKANPRKAALPLISSSSSTPMKRSLPLSTPSPNDQLKLQMSVENSQVAEEFTPPKSHEETIQEDLRPCTPAFDDLSILGPPVEQSTPQVPLPVARNVLKIRFIKKGSTVPKKPVFIGLRKPDSVVFTLLGRLEKSKPIVNGISMATQADIKPIYHSVEVQTDVILIPSPRKGPGTNDSLINSQPSTFVLEKETTDAVIYSDSEDSISKSFYKRSRRLSSSDDSQAAKRSRCLPPVESLDQFYSPLKQIEPPLPDEDSIPSAQKTIVNESDPEDEVMSATPPQPRKVFCYSSLQRDQAKMVQSWANRVNADVVNVFNDSVTHLIVKADEENRTQRTLKFLYAVACRKWVVSMDWVQQCINQGQFVDEEPFEVFDMEGEDGPRRARICDPQTKLFQAFEFCCVEPFSEVTTAQLCDLLKLCGAVVVHGPSQMTKCRRHSIVIVQVDDEDFALQRQATLWHDQHGVLTVSREWILDCLASHRLLSIRNHLICKQTVSMLRVMGFDELLLAD